MQKKKVEKDLETTKLNVSVKSDQASHMTLKDIYYTKNEKGKYETQGPHVLTFLSILMFVIFFVSALIEWIWH